MKRRLKSLFRVAIAFVVAGITMMFVGLFFGGAKELSKEVAELVHVVRAGVSAAVERIPMLESVANINGFTLIVDKDEVSVEVNEEYGTMEGAYSDLQIAFPSEVKELDVSILSGKCEIRPSANGCFGIESSEGQEFQCYVEEETLYVSVFPADWPGNPVDTSLILYIPVDCYFDQILLFFSGEGAEIKAPLYGKELNISSVYGVNSFQEELVFEEASITAGVGTLGMEALTAEEVEIEVSNASVDVQQVDAGSIMASVGMGDLILTGNTTGDMQLNCGMGSVTLVLQTKQDAYNYDISGSAESLSIGTDTLAGMMMERFIDNGAKQTITISCAMGSVLIEFEHTE